MGILSPDGPGNSKSGIVLAPGRCTAPTFRPFMALVILALVVSMGLAAKRVPDYDLRYRATSLEVWQAWPTALAVVLVCARTSFFMIMMVSDAKSPWLCTFGSLTDPRTSSPVPTRERWH